MQEHESLALCEIRRDFLFIEIGLNHVRYGNHYDVGGLDCFGCGENLEALFLGHLYRLALGIEPYDYIVTAVLEVERMRMPLGTIADYGERFIFKDVFISVLFLIYLSWCHIFFLLKNLVKEI